MSQISEDAIDDYSDSQNHWGDSDQIQESIPESQEDPPADSHRPMVQQNQLLATVENFKQQETDDRKKSFKQKKNLIQTLQ